MSHTPPVDSKGAGKMSKNRYIVSKVKVELFQVFADDAASAVAMVEQKLYKSAGSETEDGYTSLQFPGQTLTEYKALPFPRKTNK